MKIAFYHELHQGGARRAVVEIGKRFKKTDNVDLYVSGSHLTEDEKDSFHHTFSFPFRQREWERGNWKSKLFKDTIEYFNLMLHNLRIARQINKRHYDLIFVHPSQFTQAPFVMLFLRKPIIYYCQEPLRIVYDKALNDLSYLHGFKKGYELSIRILRRIIDVVNLRSADVVFANSKFSKESIKNAYGVKARVMYLGVDHQFFKPYKCKKEFDVLYIGSNERVENYHLLKDAMKNFSSKTTFKEHFPGRSWLSDGELRDLYNRSKIVLCLHKNEPFGLIPIEAASCGAVVIALDSGGHKESVVNGVSGYLVSDDSMELTKKIKLLLSNPEKLNRMAKNARANIVKNWTWNRNSIAMREEMLKHYGKRD